MPLFGAPGQRIGYQVYPHPRGAPPVVLLHGFTASAASFEANLDGLREHFTVVTVELLGHGSSDAPIASAAYAPEQAVRRLLNLFDHLGFDQVLLCGHSLGGALALRFALDVPGRVAGLVIINSSSAAGTPEWREAARAGMATMAARVRAEGTAFLKSTRLYPAHSRRLDPLSKELLTRDFDRIQPAGLAGTAESLVVDVNAYERHGELDVPMLLVVGDRDADFAPQAEAFAARFPAGLVHTVHLPEAGHAANLEQPREFEAALVEFARAIGYLPPAARGRLAATRLMTTLGGGLVVAGIGLLAAALFLNGGGNGDDGGPILAAPAPSEQARPAATPTPEEQTAGTRAAGPLNAGGATATAALATPPAASPTAAATATPASPPAATPTTRPAAPQPTNTPAPAATPTESPTPAPTATPSGPYAAISGPATAEVGATAVFYDASAPHSEVLKRTWTTPSGTVPHEAGVPVTFPSPGCYTVSLTVLFKDGTSRAAVQAVSVGGVPCN